MSLQGKVALIAGASRGVGADVAGYLARAGAKVAVAARTEVQQDPRLPGTIHSVAEAINAAGGTALPVVMNLRDPDSIAAAVQKVVDTWGRLDILMNNAAIFVPGTIETVQLRHIDVAFQVNMRGYVLAMREAIPHIRKAGGGHIVNVSSGGSVFPGPGPYPPQSVQTMGDIFYGPEKSFIEHFSQRQAMFLQQDGIAVNVLSPNHRIKTPGNVFFEQDRDNPKLEFETADEMGKAMVWLCEQDPRTYTGNLLYDLDVCKDHNL